MDTKQELIRKIKKCQDENLIELISKWLDNYDTKEQQDTFSEEEIAGVREGFEQYRKGRVYSAEHAEKLFEEWLKEK